jgi:hypothetical protein
MYFQVLVRSYMYILGGEDCSIAVTNKLNCLVRASLPLQVLVRPYMYIPRSGDCSSAVPEICYPHPDHNTEGHDMWHSRDLQALLSNHRNLSA